MYIYELNDVIFFIKSYKSSFKHFNINDYIKFSESNTISGTTVDRENFGVKKSL